MTKKEKAQELVDRMHLKQRPSLRISTNEINLNDTFFNAKECALIAVDEIIKSLKITLGHLKLKALDKQEYLTDILYWEEIKQEIKKL